MADRVASGVVDTSRSQADDQLAELSLTEEEKLVLAKVADILRTPAIEAKSQDVSVTLQNRPANAPR